MSPIMIKLLFKESLFTRDCHHNDNDKIDFSLITALFRYLGLKLWNRVLTKPFKGAFMLNFWGQNQRFQTWLEQNAVASMLIFE